MPERTRKARRAPRAAILAAAVAVTAMLSGCGDGSASLPACAQALPLPDGIEVAGTIAEPEVANPTCAVALASTLDVAGVVRAMAATFATDGIAHAIQHQTSDSAALRLDGPLCGSVLVFAAGSERVTDAVDADQTPVLVSLVDCTRTGGTAPPGP